MHTVTSSDGTRIAMERHGTGHPVVLIGGAFNDRSTMTALAAALAEATAGRLGAVQYDRRGRGDSGPLGPALSAKDRVAAEIADLRAVLDSVGGSAHLFGHSSGGALALEAAARGLAVTRVAVYEPPYVVPGTRPQSSAALGDRIAALIDGGDRDSAVSAFLTEAGDVSAQYLDGMRQNCATWGGMLALAHTLPNDIALHGPRQSIPASLGGITCPALVLDGGASPDWTRAGAAAAAAAIDCAEYRTLAGQDHSILRAPGALVDPLSRFFT